MYAASPALGFFEYAADKAKANTTSGEYAWHIVGHTGDKPKTPVFNGLHILCARWPVNYSHDAAILILLQEMGNYTNDKSPYFRADLDFVHVGKHHKKTYE